MASSWPTDFMNYWTPAGFAADKRRSTPIGAITDCRQLPEEVPAFSGPAMEAGLPPATGVALGFDRLAMIAAWRIGHPRSNAVSDRLRVNGWSSRFSVVRSTLKRELQHARAEFWRKMCRKLIAKPSGSQTLLITRSQSLASIRPCSMNRPENRPFGPESLASLPIPPKGAAMLVLSRKLGQSIVIAERTTQAGFRLARFVVLPRLVSLPESFRAPGTNHFCLSCACCYCVAGFRRKPIGRDCQSRREAARRFRPRRAADLQEPLLLVPRRTQAQGGPAPRPGRSSATTAANPASRPSSPATARKANCSAASPSDDDDEVMSPEGERLSTAQVGNGCCATGSTPGRRWPDALAGDDPSAAGALGLPAAGATGDSGRQGCEMAAQRSRSLRPRPAGKGRAAAVAGSRPRDADPPADARPDRPAADARGGRRVRRRQIAATPTKRWSTDCWLRRTTASAGAATGSTPPATPISDGYEKDKPRHVWFYRDWVINALNRDLPYDQFIIEQTRRRPAAQRDAGPDRRHRLPAQLDDQRGRAASIPSSSAWRRCSTAWTPSARASSA